MSYIFQGKSDNLVSLADSDIFNKKYKVCFFQELYNVYIEKIDLTLGLTSIFQKVHVVDKY